MRLILAALAFVVASAVAADLPLAPVEYGPLASLGSSSASAIDGTWLVAWSEGFRVLATRIDRNGRILDVPAILVATETFGWATSVVSLGDRWILFTADRACTIHTDGSVTPVAQFKSENFTACAASPNGSRISCASGTESASLLIFDRTVAKIAERGLIGERVTRMTIGDDGSGVAITSRGTVVTFDAGETITNKTAIPDGIGDIAAIAHDGNKTLAVLKTRSNDMVRVVVEGSTIGQPRTIFAANGVVAAANGHGWTLFFATTDPTRTIQGIDIGNDGEPIGQPHSVSMGDFLVDDLASNGESLLLVHRERGAETIRATLFRSLDTIEATRQDIESIGIAAMEQRGFSMAPTANGSFIAAWYDVIRPPSYAQGNARDAVVRVRFGAISSDGVTSPFELQRGPVDHDTDDSQDEVTTAVAVGDDRAAVVWQLERRLMAAIVTIDGALVTAPVPVAPTIAQKVAIGWNGSAFQIVWVDVNGTGWSASLTASGIATKPFAIADEYGGLPLTDSMSIACKDGECVAAWLQGYYPYFFDASPPQIWDLHVVRFGAGGNVLSSHVEADIANEHLFVTLDEHGDASLVTYGYPGGNPWGVSVSRLARDGTPLDWGKTPIGAIATPSIGVMLSNYASPFGVTADGYFAMDSRGRLFFASVAFRPQPKLLASRDIGTLDVFPIAAAQSGLRSIAVLANGDYDPKYLNTRFFIHDMTNAMHRRAAR